MAVPHTHNLLKTTTETEKIRAVLGEEDKDYAVTIVISGRESFLLIPIMA